MKPARTGNKAVQPNRIGAKLTENTNPLRMKVTHTTSLAAVLLLLPSTMFVDAAIKTDANSPSHRLIVRVVLAKNVLKVGDALSGKVVFENASMATRTEVLYPGLNDKFSLPKFAASVVGVKPDGSPLVRCKCQHADAETVWSVNLIESNDEIWRDMEDGEELELLEAPEAPQSSGLLTTEPGIHMLGPGEKVEVPFTFPDARDALPRLVILEKEQVVTGTYEIRLNYKSSGDYSWSGAIQSNPIRITLLRADKD